MSFSRLFSSRVLLLTRLQRLSRKDRQTHDQRERERDQRRTGVSTPTSDAADDAPLKCPLGKSVKISSHKGIEFGLRLLHSRALLVRSFLVTHTRTHTHTRERERERQREEKDLASRTGRGVNNEYSVVR